MANNASDVLSVAAGEVGYCAYVNDANATGTKYGRFYADLVGEPYFGEDNIAWCAMFASWVFAQAGATCPGLPKAYVPWIESDAQAAGAVLGDKTDAQPGDVILFDWGGDGSPDHVGIVESNEGGYVATIEGNVSRCVGRRNRDWGVVCCVIRPTWDDSAPSQSDRIAAASLVIDGDCGALTCTEWQSQLGCQVDGEVTGQWSGNRRYTRAASCITGWSNVGQSDTVMAIQTKLGILADGYWGYDTSACIQRYLNDYGFDLYVDSDFGPKTASALQQSLNAGQWR